MIAGWKVVESTELYAGLGIQLIDDHTGAPVEAAVSIALDVEEDSGWRPVEHRAIALPGSVYFYPGLERHRDPAGRPPRRYRVRAVSDEYHPLYLAGGGTGVIVPVWPWSADTSPAEVLHRPEPVAMLPRPGLALSPNVPVLRGSVITADGAPVAGALLSYDQPQPQPAPARPIRVLTEADGEFALPVRKLTATVVDVTVTPPSGPPASFPFTWRDDVKKNNRLTI